MKTLAFESSARAASVALCQDGALLAQYYQNGGLTHSRTLLSMAESMLRELELTPKDIDRVAVAAGPGSFTGIRIGVAAAKGFAWGLGIPVCGVSTLEAMAHLHADRENVIICPVMDARRQQVYNALFTARGGKLQRLCPDRAVSLAELAEDAKKLEKTIFLVGDGAQLCYNFLVETGLAVCPAPEPVRQQNAWGVICAANEGVFVPAEELEPFYLRPSQAEREKAARQAEDKLTINI